VTAAVGTESDPLALVALTGAERVALGFARSVLRLLGEAETGNPAARAEYLRQADVIDRIGVRARASVVRGGQPGPSQGIIDRDMTARKG
jgi:hypothetical protein